MAASSRKRAHWTPEQVEKYFSGITDAASHVAERVSNNYLKSGQPLSPLPNHPPVKPPRLQERIIPQKLPADTVQRQRRLVSATDPQFLDEICPSFYVMGVKRCTVCHLYIDGAPSQDLVHEGQYGPACKSGHHPNPCTYVHKDSGSCSFYEDVDSNASNDDKQEEKLTKSQLYARDKARQQELDKMAEELVTLRSRQDELAKFSKMSAEMEELGLLVKSLRPPLSSGGSLAPKVLVSLQFLVSYLSNSKLRMLNLTWQLLVLLVVLTWPMMSTAISSRTGFLLPALCQKATILVPLCKT